MRSLNRNKLLALSVLLLALIFGNFQEKVKLSLNNVIKYSEQIPGYDELGNEVREKMVDEIIASRPVDFFNSNNSFSFFFKYNKSGLNKLKWVLALVFIGVFFLFNSAILHLWFNDKSLLKFLLLAYLVLSVLSIAFFGFGKMVGDPLAGYGVARKILGALQSLIPVMILFPAVLIFESSKKN